MSKADILTATGRVVEVSGRGFFVVKVEAGQPLDGQSVTCKTNGRMRQHNITVTTNDRVTIEVSSYDLSTGRIVYRH